MEKESWAKRTFQNWSQKEEYREIGEWIEEEEEKQKENQSIIEIEEEEMGEGGVWEGVMEMTKWAQENNTDPLLWSIQVTSSLNAAAVSLPSIQLAHRLVSHICFNNHVPITWKFLEKAMAVRLVPPLLVLSLLSTRVLSHRHLHPSAYTLYIELLNRHSFSLSSHIHNSLNYNKVMSSIHHLLNFSQAFASNDTHPGVVLVHFLFTVVSQLLQASLDDEGLLQHKPRWLAPDADMMLVDAPNHNKDALHRKNTALAIQTIARFLQHKVTSRILSLVQRNM